MQNVIELFPVAPSIDQLSRIIGNVAAPAFFLGAVAAFISVLVSRMNRVVDRARFLHGISAARRESPFTTTIFECNHRR